jgi:hypothetical protein
VRDAASTKIVSSSGDSKNGGGKTLTQAPIPALVR